MNAVCRSLPALLCAVALHALAAPLQTTPDTLTERATMERDARDRAFDLAAGRLGNLRRVNIVAPDCVVRVVSGPENRLFRGRLPVQAREGLASPGANQGKRPLPRNVDITVGGDSPLPRVGLSTSEVCFTLQLATAQDMLLRGDNMVVLFDRTELTALRVFLNPGYGMRLWFQDVRMGLLDLDSNAAAAAGGTGQVEWLRLGSSLGSTSLLFHDMDARHAGVTTTASGARFSVRIGPQTEATYYQPARAPGTLAKLYPIWIDGPVAALKVPVGQVDAMPLSAAVRQETLALRDTVMGRAGPRPVLPSTDPAARQALAAAPMSPVAPVSPRQRVSDALQHLLPAQTTIDKVDLWHYGAALEGQAPDSATVNEWVKRLDQSGEVRNAKASVVRPGPGGVSYRVLVNFMCAAPGEPSVCLAGAGAGDAYTTQQIEAAITPLLGPQVKLKSVRLEQGGIVALEGTASDSEANAALERIGTQIGWMTRSTSAVGKSGFRAWFQMVCTAAPRTSGICVAQAPAR